MRTTAVFLGASILCYAVGGTVLALSQAGLMTLNGAAVFGPASLILAVVVVDWVLHYPRQAALAPRQMLQ
jgi:hypothetical protein